MKNPPNLPVRKLSVIAVAACFSGAVLANPTAPTVVHGSASFASAGNILNITNSPNAIINWGSFSIGVNELTRFIQQSGSSAVLNRVIGQDPSAILGALQSNGKVFLINPNGIVFGAGAQINVAGLVASTLNLSNDDFLKNRMKFTDGAGAGSVVNQGSITGGSVYLIGKAVTNNGLITSPNGEVILAAGNRVELVNPGTPRLRVEVVAPDNEARNLGTITAEAGRIGIYAGLIHNSGRLNASSAVVEGGRVLLRRDVQAAPAEQVAGSVTLQAENELKLQTGSSVTADGPVAGKIELSSGGNVTLEMDTELSANGASGGSVSVRAAGGTLLSDGKITASGEDGQGGRIILTGSQVGLLSRSRIDASGSHGGGTVLVGGDYQGRNPEVQNAARTLVAPGAEIRADAEIDGAGGKVVVWADGDTRFHGTISARGGADGGNGGLVEVSGKQNLTFAGAVDTTSPKGAIGTLLLDPDDLYISTGPVGGAVQDTTNPFQANDGVNDYYVLNTTLQALPATTAVQLQANHDIIFQTGLAMPTTGAGSVTMTASHEITMAGFGLTTAGGNVSMTAGTGGITNLGAIDLGGGALTLNSTGAITQNAGSLISGATSVVKQGAGTLTLSNANTYTGLTTVSAGVLNLQNSNATGTVAGGVTVAAGAALELQGGITVGAEALSITGTGVGANGALRNTGGANTWGGTVTLTGASEIQSDVGTLTLNAANAVTGANTNLTVDGPGSTLVSGTITTGTGTLTKAGAGTLTLQGANTYTGLTTVSAGVLNLQNSTATGTTAGGVTVAAGAALELQGGITVGAEALSINGTGVLGNGALRNISGNNTWGGTVTLTGASEIQLDVGTLTLNAANAVTGVNTNLTVDGPGSTLVSGTITTGTGTLTKVGAGTLTLSNANTYTGLTTVSAGVLNLQNSNATGTAAGGVTVANGAALELQGGITVSEALTLSGTGILATGALRNISGNNTWGGTVTLAANAEIQSDAGTLTLNAANSVTGATRTLTFDGAGNGLIGGTITTTTGGLIKSGIGTLTLQGANTYAGATTINAGVLNVQNAQGTGTTAGGVTVAAGAALELQGGITVGAEALSINGTGVLGNGALRNISGNNTWGGTVTLAANAEIQSDAGTLTLNAANSVTGATRTLTFDGAGNGLIGGTITTTTGGLIKSGTGALTLQGASTYTGATTINAGNLALSGANGSVVAGVGSVFTVHSGGTLTLDNSVANNTNRISDTNTLTLNGGEFNYIGSNVAATNASETVGALALPANASTVTAVAGTGGSTQLTFASVNRTVGGGATVLFRGDNLGAAPGATNTNIVFTAPAGLGLVGGNTSMVNKPIVPWAIGDTLATGSGIGFVTYNIDPLSNAANATGIRPLSLATEYTTATGVAGVNLAVTAPVSPDISQTFNSMLLSGGSTYTIGAAGAAKTVTVTSGAIFSAAGAANTITGRANPDLLAFGAVEGKVSAIGNLDITTAQITGTAGLTKAGAGNLTLGSANTYTGTTTINRGTLFEGVSNAIATGVVTVRSGGVFDLNGNSDVIGALNLDSGFGTGASVMTGAGTLTLGGNVALNANGLGAAGATISGNLALGATRTFTVANGTAVNDLDISAIVSGATFGIIKAGTGTLDLSGANTYTGATTINAGVLSVDTLANGGVASNIGQSTNAAGNLVLGGGTLQYTGATTGIDRNFTLTAATTSSIDVASAATNLTLSGASAATTGALTKIGGGTLTLSGANLYTGATTINAGVLSANTLANGGVASSIGASTNAAANLVLGGGRLQYTGGTVSTNRSYTLTAGTTSTIDVTDSAATLTVSGASTATTGALVKAGPGVLELSGANLHTGLTTINAGTLRYGVANALSTGGVTVNDGGIYNLNGFSDSIGALTVNSGITGGSVTTGAGILTLTGNIASTGGAANASISGNLDFGATRTVTTTNAADGLTISAAISGAGGLTKAGAGTLTLSGNSSYTGLTTVSAGVLNLQNSNATGTAAGGVTVAAGAALELQGGITVGAEALSINGTGVLGNGALRNISGNNTWGGTVTLAANAEIQSDAGTLTLNAANSVTGATRTLTFDGAGNGLIGGTITTTTGGLIKSGIGTLTLQGANTYAGATTINAGVLNVQNAQGTGTTAGGVTVAAGAALELQGGITVGAEALSINGTGVVGNGALRNISGDNIWGGTVTLAGNSELQSDAGTLTLNAATSVAATTRTLTFDGAGNGLIAGAITGTTATLTKNGAGTLTLQGASTYAGATAVNVGVLNIQNALATGTTAGGVTVANHAALELQGGITVGAETLSISGNGVDANGALRNISGNNTWGGTVTLAANAEIQSDAGTLTLNAANAVTGATRTLTFDGAGNGLIGGTITTTTGGLIKNGIGTLTLSGANTYAGATTINAGVLNVQNAQGTGTTAGGVTVAAGAALELQGGITVGAEALTINGSGVAANGALRNISGNNTWGGTVTLGANASIGGNGSLTLSGTVNDIAAGTSTLTQVGSGTLTFSNTVGATNALAAITTSTGQTTAINGGSVRTVGAQTYDGIVTSSGAATLISTGGGNITANNTGNNFNGNLILSTSGTASIVDSNSLSIGTSSVGSITAQVLAGDLTLNGAITATAAGVGDWIVLAAGDRFLNPGSNTLSPGASGRFLVWSANPNPFGGATPDDRGGLAYNFKQYNATYGVDAVAGSGNGFLYTLAPSVTPGLTGVVSKTYDGATTATLAGANYSVGGAVDGDIVTLNNPVAGTYDNRNVGVLKNVAVSGISVAGATNGAATVYGYSLGSSTANDNIGTITARAITVTAVTDTKTYDGSTSSAGVPTITVGSLAPVGGDTAAFTQAFDNRNAGITKTLTPTGSVTDGNGGLNYNVTLAADGTGVINQRLITVTAVTDTKTYDGSTSSAGVPTITVGSLAPVGGDTAAFTQAFDNRNAGITKTLTPTGSVTDGNGGLNYNVTLAADGTGVINQRLITVTAVTDTKTYDGSTSSAGVPTITVGSLAPVGGDTAAFTQAFDNRNAGITKTLTPTGSVTDGNGGLNYNVTLAADGTGVINQRLITVTAVTDTKTYDGSTSSAGVPTITVGSLAPVGGDTAAFTQAFDNRNAGITKTLTPTGSVTDGNGGLNYNVTLAADGTGVINQRLITVTAVTDTKTYDGSTSSAGVPTITVGSLAPVGGDTAAFTQAFDNRNAGITKTLTPTGSVTDGNGGLNYNVTLAADGTGVINQRLITVTAVTDTKTYDGSTSSAGVPTITVGSLAPVGGDTAAFTQAFDNRNAGITKTLTPTGSVTDGNGGLNYNVTLAADGTGVINQRLITVTAVTDTKTYDGSTSSAGVPTITVGSLAPVGGDTAAFTQAFDNRNAGITKTLTPTGSVTDGNGGLNYNVTLAADGTGVINQRLITVTAVTDTKTYDGSTSSAGVPTITVGSLAPVGGDTAAFTQAFDNRNAGITKTLTPTGSVTDGNGGLNYNVTLAADGTGVINQRLITVTAVTDTKTYDGSTSSAGVPTITVGSLAPVGGDTAAFTQAFDNRNAGITKTLTPTGSVTDGNGGLNYNVTLAADGTGVINQRLITVTAVTDTKTYDGSTSSAGVPTITVGSLAPVGGDTAAFTQAFDNRNAGITKTLTPTGSVTDGNGGLNYNVTLAADGTGVINQRLITVTAVTDTKTYDGSTSSAGVPTITVGSLAPVGGDTAAFTQAFDNRNAGITKTLTPTGSVTDGNGGLNYNVTLAADGTGVINQRLITVTAVTDTKTYDGSTSSAGVPTITVGSLAPVGGDTAAFTQAFDNRNAGITKTLTPTGSVTDGNGGLNYNVTLAADGTGVINQRLITVTAVTDTKTYDGSTSSAGVPTITVGSLAPVGGDTAAFTQAFDNRNAGITKTLTPTGSVTDGNGGLNYNVTLAADGTGVINQRLITVTAVTDTKTYDGSTSSAGVPTITVGSLAPVGGDTAAFTQAFDNRNAGITKTLTPTGSVTDGNGGLNYNVTLAADGTGVINQRLITVTAVTDTKTYDGSTSSAGVPTITVGSLAPVGGDTAAFTQAFDNRNAGITKTLTPTGSVTDGNGGLNYNVTLAADGTGVINQRLITVTAVTDTKTYDGSTSSAGVPTITVGSLAPVGGDTAAFTQAFDNRNAGITKTLTPTGSVTDGNGGLNYNVTLAADGTGVITAAPLTVTANDASKPFGQILTFAGTEFTSSGLVAGETIGSVTLVSAGAAAAATVAGSPYAINPSAAVGGTFAASNYTITYQPGLLIVTPGVNPPVGTFLFPNRDFLNAMDILVPMFKPYPSFVDAPLGCAEPNPNSALNCRIVDIR